MASSSSNQQWNYDVFLSFRGEDTRNNFTSHLYKELCRKGIITFKDDRELPKGEPVPQQLPKAIEDSRILVIIFSKNYATSTWCLDELVKIFECKKASRQTVLPIFYDVTPSQVRKQDGKFGEPFPEYEQLYKDNIEKVQTWRVASKEVANLSGWHLNDRDESDFIQDIVKDVLSQLRRSNQCIAGNFVGMDSRLETMHYYLDIGQLSKVRIIGICGMGGIGKTTIASVVYKEMYCQFESSCFLANVRESSEKHGLVSLQKQLLSATLMGKDIEVYDVYRGSEEIRNRLCRKRLMVILDDIDELEQLESLIGKRDEHWFGIGSRIIITTRDEHLLNQYGVDKIYRVKELNDDDALQLFCLKAFKNHYPLEEYVKFAKKVVEYASGLPLALTILGSSLYGKSVREWNSTLDRLKEIPNEKILSKLQISYNGIHEMSQKIFLDIACFFKGMDKVHVIKVLESCGLFPDSGMRELIDKSLITISAGTVCMHDLVQEMGQEIVRQESREEPGQRSRIWLYKDLCHIETKDMETVQVKAIVLQSREQKEEHLNAKVFSKMKELRLLVLQNLPLTQEIEYLSNELRYLEWYGYPFKSLPSNFQPDKLVELHMQCSSIEQMWKRSIKPIKSLKIVDLRFSENLIKTPDFREVPNLEELILEGCRRLCKVHQSIGVLKRLVSLNLENCENLVALPNSMCNLKSLKILILRGCSKLEKLPEKLGDMTCLEEFDAAGIGTRQLPLAKPWDFLVPSWLMPWKNPHPMAMVFPSLSALPFLKKLNLSYSNIPEGAIPNDLSRFPSLKYLLLDGNDFVTIPSSFNQLTRLKSVSFSNCKRLKSVPDLPSTIKYVYLDDCTSLETLPNIYEKNNSAKKYFIKLSNCSKLNENQGKMISMAFVWLKSYLLSLPELRMIWKMRQCCNNAKMKFCDKNCIGTLDCDLSFRFKMIVPGSDIPDWFNYQSVVDLHSYRRRWWSFRIQLPPDSKYKNIAGFAFCAVIDHDDEDETKIQFNEIEFTISSERIVEATGTVYAITIGDNVSHGKPHGPHLFFWFLPNSRVDPSEKYNPTEVLLSLRDIRKCGMRVIFDQDIEELIQLDKPLQHL